MRVPIAVLLLAFSLPAATLRNEAIQAEVGPRGLSRIEQDGWIVQPTDGFAITIDGREYRSESLPAPQISAAGTAVRHLYQAGDYRIEAAYELQPGWAFLGKRLLVHAASGRKFRVNRVLLFSGGFDRKVRDVYVRKSDYPRLQTKDYGGFLRFDAERGLLLAAQNPFLEFASADGAVSLGYAPEMDWDAAWGPFESDRALFAPYRLSGRRIPSAMVPEWKLATPAPSQGMDEAEVAAFTRVVRAFLLDRSPRPANVFVGWCVNDYQIDIADEAGRTEYKRIIDRAAELGAEHVLFAPANTALALRANSTDDWSWENLLWLGLGQKIRRGEWRIGQDPIPNTVREMLDYAGRRKVQLLAYVYPVLGFLAKQHPEWLAKNTKRERVDLGVRGVQDWLIDALVGFRKQTGISGYSFDHGFLWFEGTSRYAQWHGWRRVMEELRRRSPDVVIDGRQAYHMYGPWSWLAGTYPHPTYADEQPESFEPFPDLHFDRVSANRQRYTAWRYRNLDFTPSELVPGFITHQTPRIDEQGQLPVKKVGEEQVALPFRERDWDYLGWRFSLLSSIATAGLNNVLNMIPARDVEEYGHFSEADKRWFRGWIDWTARNRQYLANTRTILGQPRIGAVDGTSAIVGQKGFLFLFNPNGGRLAAEFRLDESIGLSGGSAYALRELYPRAGRLVGKPGEGFWQRGDAVSLHLDGTSATVLEIVPASELAARPLLFNAPGAAALKGGTLTLTGVSGEAGAAEEILVLTGAVVRRATVNGVSVEPAPVKQGLLLPVRYAGAEFRRSHEVKPGSSFVIPKRIKTQLAARRKAWPIPWTPDDYKTTWLVPERLLLFVQIADPDDRMAVSLKLNGSEVPLLKAYSSVRTHRPSFVGFYADVSSLQPEVEYKVELSLPQLAPGQFQGLFFDNVEPEYTTSVAAK